MSETKPKPKFCQFHLSTAIALTVAAGLMMFVNYQNRLLAEHEGSCSILIHAQGWPLPFRGDILASEGSGRSDTVVTALEAKWASINIAPLFTDIMVGTSVLFLTALGCEFLIRRREARQT